MSNTLGIKLDGDIALGAFANVMQQFHALLRTLTAEIAGSDRIEWQIAELKAGSAYAEVLGIAEDEEEPERVIAAYKAVGQALQAGTVVPYTVTVGDRANELIKAAANGEIGVLRFYVTGEEVASITPSIEDKGQAERRIVLGSVTGIVETLSRRPGLSITVYDDLFDHAVRCTLSPDQYVLARDVWGKRVIVSGRVGRDPETGRVKEIHDVLSVKVVETLPDGGRRARGILPWQPTCSGW